MLAFDVSIILTKTKIDLSLDPNTMVVLALLIAASDPEDKDQMIKLVVNCFKREE